MTPNRLPTLDELALLGLSEGASLPGGGTCLHGVYFSGSSTSEGYVSEFSAALGQSLEQGSLNLRLRVPVQLTEPKLILIQDEEWDAVPAVLNECAVGFHAWKRANHDSTFLEVFAPVKLAEAISLSNGDRVAIRLLAGRYLSPPG